MLKVDCSEAKYTMTIQEAATALGIDLNLAYNLVRSGEIPARRLGRRWVVLRQPFERMMGHDIMAPGNLRGGMDKSEGVK